MDSIVVIQARTTSSRLPAKSLLPINNIPLVVLVAKRAENTGREVIVVTSNQKSDDTLCHLLKKNNIKCFRGSLENVLQRFIEALENKKDETIVFRLTADNVFPDGGLIDDLEKEFLVRDLEYMICGGLESGLPYGVSAEVTYLKHIRFAGKDANDDLSKEHVTPLIRSRYGVSYFEKYKEYGASYLRCTIDCLDDYLRVVDCFSSVEDPVNINFLDLIKNIENFSPKNFSSSSLKKLILGTAQLGSCYGIANVLGQPTQKQSKDIIKTAISNGFSYIDTAREYKNSEKIIGKAIKFNDLGFSQIITKLSHLHRCPDNAESHVVSEFVNASFYQSCYELGVTRIDVLMLHQAKHLVAWGGTVFSEILKLKSKGLIGDIGVSIQTTEELKFVLTYSDVKVIQLPNNILDWRWEKMLPEIKKVKNKRELIIHVRSVFLQGLLTSDDFSLWNKANVDNPEPVIKWLENTFKKNDFLNVKELCLNYIDSLDWVDGMVIGVESEHQLIENIKLFSNSHRNKIAYKKILVDRPKVSENTLNPVNWR